MSQQEFAQKMRSQPAILQPQNPISKPTNEATNLMDSNLSQMFNQQTKLSTTTTTATQPNYNQNSWSSNINQNFTMNGTNFPNQNMVSNPNFNQQPNFMGNQNFTTNFQKPNYNISTSTMNQSFMNSSFTKNGSMAAFDSLLTSPTNSNNKIPMNSMQTNSINQNFIKSNTETKSLTKEDIFDLLS